MRAFSERFREESWFGKPWDRSWATVEKALLNFIKIDLKKVGGKITKETSKRNFERFKIAYQSLFFQVINEFLPLHQIPFKNSLFYSIRFRLIMC